MPPYFISRCHLTSPPRHPCLQASRSGVTPALLLAAGLATAQPAPPAAAPPASTASAPTRAAPAASPAAATGAPATSPPAANPSAGRAANSSPAGSASPAPPGAAGSAETQRVEITGGRLSDSEERRRATASKIVIGREEIDKFGDATVSEVLRRLPGVTTPGAPGRGGPPRMRGLGGGFTQLLIDGQRMPPGFSLDNLTPEQVERIEILRAPTAETGARAIAGTINIITREGFKVRLNDLRMGFGYENGQFSPGINWSHNNTSGPLTYTLNASLFRPRRESASASRTQVTDEASGTVVEDRSGQSSSQERRFGTNLSGRLMWRLNEQGDSLSLMPSVFHTESHNEGRFSLVQNITPRSTTPVFYDTGTSVGDSRFTTGRLGLAYRQRLGGVRLEANGNGGVSKSQNDSLRTEFRNATGSTPWRSFSDRTTTNERSLNLTLKASGVAGGGGTTGQPAADHAIVTGAEIEAVNREETRISVPNVADFGDNLKASTLRLAAYAQDEWQLNPNWGVHAGLRWEGITTRGDSGQGSRPTNRTSVWTPLVHAVYRPDPKSRDQVRISLTRSYRSPQLGALIARPSINRDFIVCAEPAPGYPQCPIDQGNRETYPDSAGNSDLKPELATGIDIALERYLAGGGVLSANLFHRNISNLIRGQVQLENSVAWSNFPRWVRRQRNIGDATTSGIELEAKFRLDQLVTGAPGVELRSNLSLYNSRVKTVPGPDNRLDQQAKATGNLGADYRLRGTPFTLGGNLNWVPGYTTRLDVDQTTTISTKRVWDFYTLWAINPNTGLRLMGSNLDPRQFTTTNINGSTNVTTGAGERTTSQSFSNSYINWQLRLELKL